MGKRPGRFNFRRFGSFKIKNKTKSKASTKSKALTESKASSKLTSDSLKQKEQSKIDERFKGYVKWARNPNLRKDCRSEEEKKEFVKLALEHNKKAQEERYEFVRLLVRRDRLRKKALNALPPRLKLAALQPYNDREEKFRYYPLKIPVAESKMIQPRDFN